MALMHEFNISEEERELTLQRVRYLLNVQKTGHITKEAIERLYLEWESLAQRIKRGSDMIDKMVADTHGAVGSHPQFQAIADLFSFLACLLSFYSQFFYNMFGAERYYRAHDKIMNQIHVA